MLLTHCNRMGTGLNSGCCCHALSTKQSHFNVVSQSSQEIIRDFLRVTLWNVAAVFTEYMKCVRLDEFRKWRKVLGSMYNMKCCGNGESTGLQMVNNCTVHPHEWTMPDQRAGEEAIQFHPIKLHRKKITPTQERFQLFRPDDRARTSNKGLRTSLT